jgi:glutamine synthetase
VLREALGAAFAEAYSKLRRQDWDAYARHLTQWERDTTLDV